MSYDDTKPGYPIEDSQPHPNTDKQNSPNRLHSAQDVNKIIKDNNLIEKAVEGSMDKRAEVLADSRELDDLLQYFWPFPFPERKPPIQVTFSNGVPEGEHDLDHLVFAMPYNTFKQAILAYTANKLREILDWAEQEVAWLEKPLKEGFKAGLYNQAITDATQILKNKKEEL